MRHMSLPATVQESRAEVDVAAELGGVTTPALVLHARGDEVIPREAHPATSERSELGGGVDGTRTAASGMRYQPWTRSADA